jgi:predicted ATPase
VTTLRFEVLGPLRVIEDGVPLDLGAPKQQRVLAILLAAEPRDVSVDRLVDEIWAGDAPATATHVVRTYVSNLKGLLGDRIVSDGRHYRIDVVDDDYDAAQLEATLDRADSLLEIDPRAAAGLLDDALGSERGQPFEDNADDSPLIRARAEELQELLLRAAELRGAASLALGDHVTEVCRLRRLVERHPFRERFTAQLMVALYRSGRQAEALGAYRWLARRLRDDLGVDPSPPVRQLEERILLQDKELALRPPSNLPVAASSFVGRREDLARVIGQLRTSRLVSLVGVGGVGKSRLAVEAAHASLDDFRDGVWWIDLAVVDDEDDVAARAADVLGVSAPPGMSVTAALSRLMSGRTMLLVLDNCEHLVEAAAALVSKVLAASPGSKVLTTSRRPLRVAGEVRVGVPPMSLPVDHTGEHPLLGRSDAERLFTIRASEASSATTFATADAVDIARVCVAVDGLPLAIEMAAARTPVLSPGQIADRLLLGHGFLTADELERHPRQQTLDRTIAWSYDLLDPVASVVFERISVFAGDFGIEAATAVAGFDPIAPDEVMDGVAALVDASMLTARRRAPDAMTYRLLATVRTFAAARLHDSGAWREAATRHASHHLGVAEKAGRYRTTAEFAPWMVHLEDVRDELAPALDWSLDVGDPAMALRAVPGLLEYWQRRGDGDSAYHYGTRLLDVAGDVRPELRAYALMCASFGAVLTGDFARASTSPAEAVELARDVPGWQCLHWALMVRGQVAAILGDLRTAAEMGHAVLAVCDAHALEPQRAYGLSLLAQAEFFTDADYSTAREQIEEAIAGFRVLQDLGGLKVYGLCIAASVAAVLGDLDTAERHAVEAVTLPGDAWTAAAYIILGGYVLHPRGDLDRAERVLVRGTRLAYDTANEIWFRTGLLFLADVAAAREDWESAAWLYGACTPNLPSWGRQPRWWTADAEARRVLGRTEFERLKAAGAQASGDQITALLSRSGTA